MLAFIVVQLISLLETLANYMHERVESTYAITAASTT